MPARSSVLNHDRWITLPGLGLVVFSPMPTGVKLRPLCFLCAVREGRVRGTWRDQRAGRRRRLARSIKSVVSGPTDTVQPCTVRPSHRSLSTTRLSPLLPPRP